MMEKECRNGVFLVAELVVNVIQPFLSANNFHTPSHLFQPSHLSDESFRSQPRHYVSYLIILLLQCPSPSRLTV